MLTVIVVLLMGMIMQYHHHGHAHVCMCFNPIEHCDCHHHDGCNGCDGSCERSHCNHQDASGCSLHLDYGIAGAQHQALSPLPAMVAILADILVLADENEIKAERHYERLCIETQEGDPALWFLRGPPMC